MERLFMQRHAAIEMLLLLPSQWDDHPPSEDVRERWRQLLLDVRANRVHAMVTFWETPPREVFVT